MATRKNQASKTTTTSATPSSSGKSRGRRTSSRSGSEASGRTARTSGRRIDAMKYVGPGAAVLATGALAAAGYVLREHLGDVVAIALKTATKSGARAAVATTRAFEGATEGAMGAAERVSDSVSVDALLKYAGLQRRSTTMSVLSPTIGALCGFVAGSAATYFFGPKLLEQFEESLGAKSDSEDHAEPDAAAKATPATTTESAPVNGSLHGRMS